MLRREDGLSKDGRNIDLHIDELVLHGFTAGQDHRIDEAIKLELARLMAEQGAPSARESGDVATADASVNALSGTSPQAIGTLVSAAIHRRMNDA